MELAVRVKNEKRYAFILNYRNKTEKISVKEECFDMISGMPINGDAELPPYGVLVVKF